MIKPLIVVVLLTLTGCSALPAPQVRPPSPCDASEASYACQIERYQNVDA
jgi:hypothetical protein